jgi:hypothetical protein
MRFFVRCLLVCLLFSSKPALAQNWSFDARTIALGGVGDTGNVAVDMVDEQRPYRAIVLPFGLLQVLPNLGKLNPTEDDFDLVRAIEYAASPIHYIIDRNTSDSGQQFVTDIRNASLSRDLNAYRGFVPANTIAAEGLASPNWGGTLKLRESGDGAFQGIYIGAGPYLSMQTTASIDPALTTLLASTSPVYVRNSSFRLGNDTLSQAALAVTGGYRARMAWPGGGGGTSGLYVGANYHYLRGFRYEDFDMAARLDTDANGLLTVNPVAGSPLVINRRSATSGQGFAIDVGVAAVMDRFEVGFGVNGIANRIDWTDVERTDYSLNSLITGGDFVETPTRLVSDIRAELPVDVRANASFTAGPTTVIGEFADGYNGTSFRGGVEQRLGRLQLRAGGRHIKERFEPTVGAGVNLSDRVGLDVALFGTSANVERERHLGVAVSLRLMRRQE